VYQFFLGDMMLPIAPRRMRIRINNQNQTINLVSGKEINLLKEPGLTDFTFSPPLPVRQYPFARYLDGFQPPSYFLGEMETFKLDKEPIPFAVIRTGDNGATWDVETSMQVSLEDYRITENAEDGSDMTVDIELKQWREYGTKNVTVQSNADGSSSATTIEERPAPTAPNKTQRTYTIVSGDTLWSIAQRKLGDGTRHRELYDLNEEVIESVARERGMGSSARGYWIFPGTVIRLPG